MQITWICAEAAEADSGLDAAMSFEECMRCTTPMVSQLTRRCVDARYAEQAIGPLLNIRLLLVRALLALREGQREEAKALLREAASPSCKAPEGWFRCAGYSFVMKRRPMALLIGLLLEEGGQEEEVREGISGEGWGGASTWPTLRNVGRYAR